MVIFLNDYSTLRLGTPTALLLFMRDANKTAATVAASPVALTTGTRSPSTKSLAEMRADLVIGPASYELAHAAAWNLDCGRNSGLALIADLEGFDAVALPAYCR